MLEEVLKDDKKMMSKADTVIRNHLSNLIEYYNNPSNDKLTQVNEKVEEVKDILVENINIALNNLEKSREYVIFILTFDIRLKTLWTKQMNFQNQQVYSNGELSSWRTRHLPIGYFY